MVFLSGASVVCALGDGLDALAHVFHGAPAGLTVTDRYTPGRPLPVGEVQLTLPATDGWAPEHRSRNNQLLAHAVAPLKARLDAAVERFGPSRVGCVVGTSTSGIREGEEAIRHLTASGHFPPGFRYAQQELGTPADFARVHLGLGGPCTVISTACTSSAKALASAARLVNAGLADVVLAGGVDSLTPFTVAGFMSLDAVSPQRCNPMSRNRRGINLGEAAAFFLVSREEGPVRLAGWGETSDAHHMSAPDPLGRGARTAMELALARAGRAPAEVGYVNLHGTATVHNDAMESTAVAGLLGPAVPCSSTKPFTGHTLGAAGALEAAVCWLTLLDGEGRLPVHLWDGELDGALSRLDLVEPGRRAERPVRVAMSTSFAFGGNNVALVLERT